MHHLLSNLLHNLLHLMYFLPFLGLLEGEGDGAPAVPAEEAPETQTSAERALEMFTAPEEPAAPAEPAPAEVKPGEPAAPAEVKPGEPAVPAVPAVPKPAEPAAPVVPAGYDPAKVVEKVEDFEKTLPFFKDATFQKVLGDNRALSQSVTELSEIFGGNWREVGQKYSVSNNAELKGILEDAFSLYDIGNLNMPVGAFMDIFSKNFPEGNVKAVLAGLMKYAHDKGITVEMADQLNSPAMTELYQTKQQQARDNQSRAQADAQRQLGESREKLDKHFTEFFGGLKVDPADEVDYLQVLQAKVATDPALAKEIREGRFGTLDRVMTEYHNRQVERDNKRLEQQKNALDERQKVIDKTKGVTAAGGANPTPSEPPRKPKVNTADGEARRAAALKDFTA